MSTLLLAMNEMFATYAVLSPCFLYFYLKTETKLFILSCVFLKFKFLVQIETKSLE